MLASIPDVKNIPIDTFVPPTPQLGENQYKCKCGCILEATIAHKRKYKRNRARALCPQCNHVFTFNQMPKAKTGAYMLIMKLVTEEEKLDARDKTELQNTISQK